MTIDEHRAVENYTSVAAARRLLMDVVNRGGYRSEEMYQALDRLAAMENEFHLLIEKALKKGGGAK